MLNEMTVSLSNDTLAIRDKANEKSKSDNIPTYHMEHLCSVSHTVL